jgi:phage terminase small subunit
VTTQALIPIDDDAASHGPAMLALPNDMQRAFVRVLVTTGCEASDAAAAAGYSTLNANTLSSRASQLTHRPQIQAAIHEEALKIIRADGPMCLMVIRLIAKDPTVAPRDRLRAAQMLLDRGGFQAVTEHNVTVTHKSDTEKDREIIQLATELGLDDAAKAKLLGKPIVDATFEIVDPATDIAPPRAPSGAKITNPERTAEERAADRLRKRDQRNETPEERAARLPRVREEQRERAKRVYEEAQIERSAVAGLEDLLDLPETGIEGTPKNE